MRKIIVSIALAAFSVLATAAAASADIPWDRLRYGPWTY